MLLRVSVALFLLLVCNARARAAPVGQWIWSRRDKPVFEDARAVRPALEAAVSVAELSFRAGQVRAVLRLSPASVGHPRAVVVRFDASFHGLWALSDEERVVQTASALARVVALVRSADPSITELQLDYDCPTDKLAQWASLLRSFHERGVTTGFEVWTTSLVAQLRNVAFGKLFRELVAGHIVQVFDTGEAAGEAAEAELLQLLTRADLPFRVGVGAFERGRGQTVHTTHHDWWSALPLLAKSPRFRGTWIFAAGHRYGDRVGSVP